MSEPVLGKRWMIVTGHPLASRAADEVMAAGGTVIDAAISASAVLAVVLSHASSMGGDAFLLYSDARSGKLYGLNASGVAPQEASLERFSGEIPERGPCSALVPGLMRCWEMAHSKFGRMPFRDLVKPAIAIAAEGYPLSRVLAHHLEELRNQINSDTGCRAVYLREGRPMREGEILRQPALARTIEALASDGAREFYEGETAKSLASYCAQNGGVLSTADFAGYSAHWVNPLRTDYAEHQVYVMPPNSYGILLLLQLAGLDKFHPNGARTTHASFTDAQVRAFRAAFRMAKDQVADPFLNPMDVGAMLEAEGIALVRKAMDESPPLNDYPTGGTSCAVIADVEGNAISLVQSVYNPFGAIFLDPNTGILLNNRLSGFARERGAANSLRPGKRPAHTLCPIMVFRGGRPRWILASPGGVSQTATGAQVIANLAHFGRSIEDAVSSPRWSINRAGQLLLEPTVSSDVAKYLERRGHRPVRGADSYHFGSVKLVEVRAQGELAGMADDRREACAVGR